MFSVFAGFSLSSNDLHDSSLIFVSSAFLPLVCSLSSYSLQFLWIWHCQTSPLGASLHTQPGEASLDLGELQQVLQDEELARKLQEEEEMLLRRVRVYHDTLWFRSQGKRTKDQISFSFFPLIYFTADFAELPALPKSFLPRERLQSSTSCARWGTTINWHVVSIPVSHI